MLRARTVAAACVALPLATLAVMAAPATANAADRKTEGAALDALKRAVANYRAMDYDAALSRLQKALNACGASRCTNPTKAALLRDIGTMLFRQGDKASARKSFVDALRIDSELPLNPNYDDPDLRAAWTQAVKQAGGSGGAAGGGGGGSGGGDQPTGDFDHTPADAQKVDTPLPIFAGGASPDVRRVTLRYRGEQMNEWRRVEMKRVEGGWAGTIPCADVTLGTMRYYMLGYDENGDPVANNGKPDHPYTVPIQQEIDGPAPHLPGEKPPHACHNTEEATSEEEGGEHEAKPEPKSSTGFARFWVGVAGTFDVMMLSQGTDVCRLYPMGSSMAGLPANNGNYYCTNPDGSDFPSRTSAMQNNQLIQGQAGSVGGGPTLGTLHIMLAVDYAVTPNILAGGRLGWVFNGYPGQAAVSDGKAFGPRFHLEARGTYVVGDNPLGQVGLAPMFFLGLGVAEFDAHSDTSVRLNGIAGQQPAIAWRTGGPGFVSVGAGVRYSFSARYAFTAAARGNLAFGGSGILPSFGPELSLQYGF